MIFGIPLIKHFNKTNNWAHFDRDYEKGRMAGKVEESSTYCFMLMSHDV